MAMNLYSWQREFLDALANGARIVLGGRRTGKMLPRPQAEGPLRGRFAQTRTMIILDDPHADHESTPEQRAAMVARLAQSLPSRSLMDRTIEWERHRQIVECEDSIRRHRHSLAEPNDAIRMYVSPEQLRGLLEKNTRDWYVLTQWAMG